MYDLAPRAVFAHRRVFDNPLAAARMERMLDAVGIRRNDVPVVNLGDIDTIIEAAGIGDDVAPEEYVRAGHGRIRQGIYKVAHDPVMVFKTFVWDESKRVPVPRKYRNPHAARLARQFAGVRREIYAYHLDELRRISPHTPCALCTEHPQLWRDLAPSSRCAPARCSAAAAPSACPAGGRR